MSWRILPDILCGPPFHRKERTAQALAPRVTYVREESKVVYQSKDGKSEKVFDALEWPR